MVFPKDFVWGSAAAAYQIEGAALDDGKALSVWDTFCRQPGAIRDGDTGDTACDHYHRYAEDIALMRQIGISAYRLSISWPRVIPDGRGAVNEKGLDFYDNLVDALLEAGIAPWVTLFHWDYPYTLFQQGGWLNRESASWFADYTAVVVDRLSDRVSHWMTLNEPQCFLYFGHMTGEHAPGLRLNLRDVLLASHHSLLAHGRAVQVIRGRAKKSPFIGAAPVGITSIPATDSADDVEAARKHMFAVRTDDCWSNTWFSDPMLLGEYPQDGLKRFGDILPAIRDEDMESIRQPLDFYGANIYQGQRVRHCESAAGYEDVREPAGTARTTMGWPITPEALYWGPKFLFERYGLPIVITENGIANCDWRHSDGCVHDPQRADFIEVHLRQLERAIAAGVQAQGYFHWSIMDNFEWAQGYAQRFGLVYVDYATQQRTLKDSALWYRDFIRSQSNQ